MQHAGYINNSFPIEIARTVVARIHIIGAAFVILEVKSDPLTPSLINAALPVHVLTLLVTHFTNKLMLKKKTNERTYTCREHTLVECTNNL